MEKQYLHITTPYGEHYVVDLKTGNICARKNLGSSIGFSGGWKFAGFIRVTRCSWHPDITLEAIRQNTAILGQITWRYKNGKPRYTVSDVDYGTPRTWGNTAVHGVSAAWLGEA